MNYTRQKYYVNTESNADRQVHQEDCAYLPPPDGCKYLGEFYSPMAAVVAALTTYPSAYPCKACTQEL